MNRCREDEDGRIVVKCPDIPGVVTDGATKEEAMKNVIEAIQAVVGSEKEFNLIASSRWSV
jgi:predicted RNase H-like HicB family nuclease